MSSLKVCTNPLKETFIGLGNVTLKTVCSADYNDTFVGKQNNKTGLQVNENEVNH